MSFEDMSLEQLAAINIANAENHRRQKALEFGLREDASWGEVDHYSSELHRMEICEQRGLSLFTSWAKINSPDYVLPAQPRALEAPPIVDKEELIMATMSLEQLRLVYFRIRMLEASEAAYRAFTSK